MRGGNVGVWPGLRLSQAPPGTRSKSGLAWCLKAQSGVQSASPSLVCSVLAGYDGTMGRWPVLPTPAPPRKGLATPNLKATLLLKRWVFVSPFGSSAIWEPPLRAGHKAPTTQLNLPKPRTCRTSKPACAAATTGQRNLQTLPGKTTSGKAGAWATTAGTGTSTGHPEQPPPGPRPRRSDRLCPLADLGKRGHGFRKEKDVRNDRLVPLRTLLTSKREHRKASVPIAHVPTGTSILNPLTVFREFFSSGRLVSVRNYTHLPKRNQGGVFLCFIFNEKRFFSTKQC